MTNESGPVIRIVDDDPSVRESMYGLVRAAGYRAFAFEALAQGAVAILGTPFTDMDLLRAIRSAVSSSGTV